MKKSAICLALLAAGLTLPASANVSFNGFASVKAGITTGGDDTLYGYDKDVNFKNESLFALQVNSTLSDNLSLTGQLLARGEDNFDAGFEWAFLTYKIDEQTRINAGRLRTPFFRYSDFLDVGYAYEWVRTPQSVYSLGFDNIEGVSLYRTGQIGDVESVLQLTFGSYSDTLTLGGVQAQSDASNVYAATWELSSGNLSGRLAYVTGSLTIETEQVALAPGFFVGNLYDTLNQVGLTQTVAALDVQRDQAEFFGAGLAYDNGEWVVSGEYTVAQTKNSFLAKQTNYYVSVGKRFGTVMPFVSYEIEEHDPRTEIADALIPVAPAQLVVPVQGLVLSQEVDANTLNVGLRWDFSPSAAFKAQYTSEDNTLTDTRNGLVTFGVDLVF